MTKVREFFSDYYKVGMTVLNLLLLASMPLNPDLEFTHFTWFTIVSRILFPLIVIFFGNKGMWVFYFFTSIVNTLDISFNDFTALSAICILFLFVDKKYKWLKFVTVISYFVSVFAVAYLHNKSPYHLFAHFIGCVMLVLTVYKLKHRNDKSIVIHKELELTNDERLILEELKKGKKQKEIELFSPNTVTEKLKQARKRNGIELEGTAGTEELLNRFTVG